MAELQICLLGSFEVAWDFVPIAHSAWRHPRAQRLLKLILLRRPVGVGAEEAARLIGKGMTQADFPAAVAQIQRVLEPAATLHVDEQGLATFKAGPRCWVDIDAFVNHYRSGLAAAARGDMLPAILALQEADGLYQGDLLEELQEPWVQGPRKQYQQIYADILDRLAEGHSVLARYQDAVGFCHKALAHDPLREETYQRMMVYYFYLGDMAGAEESYRACLEAFAGAGRRHNAETDLLWSRLSRKEAPGSPGAQAAAALDPE